MVSRTSAIPWGSSPLIGSSRTRRSGSPTSASPIPRRCFIPREKCFVFFFPTPSSPTVSKISSMYPFFRIPNNSHFIFRFVYAFMLPYSPGASIRHPTRERILSSSFPLHPNISISPAVGLASPLIIFRQVVFPAPFRPINP